MGTVTAQAARVRSTAVRRTSRRRCSSSGGSASHGKQIGLGEGLVGQCALDQQKILLGNVPASAFRIGERSRPS